MTGNTFESDLQRLLAEEPFVRRLARGLLFDEHRVDDVVQQTWIAALRNPPAHAATSGTAGLRGWIAAVVRRLAANEVRAEVRRRRREATVEAAPEHASADELLAREQRRRQVVDALQALSEPYRSAVALRYLEGLEAVDIAARRGVPAATVRTWVRRGLEQMRERLDRQHGGDRSAWCTALLPFVEAENVAAAGMASTVVGAIVMHKIVLSVVAAAALLLFSWVMWPEAPTPLPAVGGSSIGTVASVGGEPAPVAAPTSSERSVVVEQTQQPRSPLAIVGSGSLRGRLLGPDLQPLANAQLDAFAFDGMRLFGASPHGGGGPGLPSAAARTAADGTFVLEGLPMHAGCAMVADADGELRQLVPLPASPAPDRLVELGDVVLEGRTALTGTVVDAAGEPLAGVEVWAADLPRMVLAVLPIERLDLQQGLLAMVPRPHGVQPADSADRDPDWAAVWAAQLQRHFTRQFVETDYGEQPDAAWLPVVLETHSLDDLWQRLPFARSRTDAAGRFRLRGVALGDNVLVARAPGRSPAVRPRVVARAGEARDVGELRLEDGEVLGGTVVDAAGAPVVGAEVRVAPIGLLGFRGVAPCERAVHSGAHGRFVVPGLSRGKVMVVWRGAAGQPWRIVGPVEVGDDVTLSMPAEMGVPIRLHLPEGCDPSAVQLFARPTPPLGELSRLQLAGDFPMVALLPGERTPLQTAFLLPGVYTLRCELTGLAPQLRVVEVPAEAPFEGEIEFVFARSPQLTVTVQDARGAPVADAEVFVQQPGNPDAHTVMASRYGLAGFGDPWPAGVLRTDLQGRAVMAVAPGRLRLSAHRGALGAAVQEVEVLGDATVHLSLVQTGAIVGRVAIGSGAAAPQYRVSARLHFLEAERAPVVAEASVRPAADGTFRIDGLQPGRYVVSLREGLPASLTLGGLTSFLQQRIGWAAKGVAEARADVLAGADAAVQFTIGGLDAQLGGVQGVVRLNGRPAEGCTIWRRARERNADGVSFDMGWDNAASATVDPAGGFVVADLAAQTCWLGVRDGKHGEFLHVFEVDVVAGSWVPVSVDVQLGLVRGTIRKHDGKPLANARAFVQARDDGSMTGRLVPTDGEGRFVIERLPVGDYRLRVHERHQQLDGAPFVVVAGDATPPLEVTCDAIYRLRVSLADDVVVAPDDMLLFGVRRPGQEGASTQAGAERSQEFGIAASGEYEIVLRIGGRWTLASPSPVTVLEPDQAVEVRPGVPIDWK